MKGNHLRSVLGRDGFFVFLLIGGDASRVAKTNSFMSKVNILSTLIAIIPLS